jgi:hypothetical protein
VEIQPSEGLTLTALSSELAVDGTSLRYEGAPTTDVDLIAGVARG